MNNISWDEFFIGIAQSVSKKSHCYSRQIGSVLVTPEHGVISVGYNGVPKHVPHCEIRNPNGEFICPRKLMGYKSGEGLQWCRAVHSERNCILDAAYNGKSTRDSILYCACTTLPCPNCAVEIIQAGIKEVVGLIPGDEYYGENGIQTKELFAEAGVKLRLVGGI